MSSWSGNPSGSGLSFAFSHLQADSFGPVTSGGMSQRGKPFAQRTNDVNVNWARAPASRETTSLSTWATHGNLSIEESDHDGQPKRSFQGIDFFAASAGVAGSVDLKNELNAEDVESVLRGLQLNCSEKQEAKSFGWKTETRRPPGDEGDSRKSELVRANQKWEDYKMTSDGMAGLNSQNSEAKSWDDITREVWCELAWQMDITSTSAVNVGGERSLRELMTSPRVCVTSKRHFSVGCGADWKSKMPVTLTGAGTFGGQGMAGDEVIFKREEEAGHPKRKRMKLNHICHVIDL